MSPHSPSPVSGQLDRASILRHAKRDQGEPFAGEVLSLLVALLALVILTALLTQRYLAVKVWKKIPFVIWTVFAILADSWAFALATLLLQHGIGLSRVDMKSCSAAIFLCLFLYVTTKISICLFLSERAFVVRNGSKRRLRSKLYLFNSVGLVCAYCVVLALNFVHRISRLKDGRCIIGARRSALVPLVACDVFVNVYLTTLFLIPLRDLKASSGILRTSANVMLRSIALRTFIGACCTATSSIVNLSVLMALDGEAAWLCFLCCNCDILFCALVIQWVTRRDDVNGTCSSCVSCSDHHRADVLGGGGCCNMSDTGCPLYDAAGRRSSAATTGWCYRRPSDGTTRAASLMLRRDSLASVHNGKPPLLSYTNSSSSDYHAAVASAGPIHWENIFSLFAYDGLQQDRPTPSEATPSMVNPTTTTAAATAEDGSGVQKMVANDTARSAATTTDPACLQRPKPSRTLSSIRSIRSIVTREPSRVDLTKSPEGG